METRANYVLVGLFTVLVLIISFGFVYWSANVSDKDSRTTLLVRIEGSVNGLSVGSQVLFNGLRVGDVRSLRIDPNDPRVVIATTQVDTTTPITTSTRATIGFAGLTGQAFIELKGGSVNERNIIQYAQEQGATPVIRADPSDVTDILATAKDIAERANNILSQFESVVNDIGPAVRTTADNITATSENVKVFTGTLAQNSGQIDEFLQSVGRVADSANTVAQELPSTIQAARELVQSVNPQSVRTTVDNVAAMSQTLREQSGNVADVIGSVRTAATSVGRVGDVIQANTPSIDGFLKNLAPISDTARSVATRLDTTLGDANRILAAVDANKVNQTLDDISATARNISGVSDMVGQQRERIGEVVGNLAAITGNVRTLSDTLTSQRESIDRFVSNIGPISDTANQAATRFNQTVTDVNSIVSGIDRARITQTIDGVATFVAGIQAKTTAVQSIIDGTDRTVQTIGSTVAGFNGTREQVDRILAGVDPQTVTRAVNNVSQATDNVARAADSVSRVATDIGNRREDINSIISNVQEATGKVNTASGRLDSVLASADKLLQSDSTEGLTVEATQTLRAIREAANNISSQIGPIAANLQSFTGRGLDEVQNFVRAATGAVNAIGTAAQNFDANPSRIIFGGSGSGDVKQFDGRTRR